MFGLLSSYRAYEMPRVPQYSYEVTETYRERPTYHASMSGKRWGIVVRPVKRKLR